MKLRYLIPFLLLMTSLVMAEIKVVVFDFGGVLAETNRSTLIDYIARSLDITEGQALTILQEWFSQLEPTPVGESTLEAAARAAREAVPPAWGIQLEQTLLQAIRPRVEMLTLVVTLRAAGYRTAILSNTVPVRAHAFSRLGLYKGFQPVVLSCEVGHSKPDPLIYRIFLRILNEPASTCLFIDDKESNVESARRAGMEAVLFSTYEQLREELKMRGILVDPAETNVLSLVNTFADWSKIDALFQAEISLPSLGTAP